MIVEHPAQAHWKPHAVSSWALPETQELLRHPEVRATTLDQCMYGADAKKATTLLTTHLPELDHMVNMAPHRGRCSHRGRHQVALGRVDGTTEFRTAHLKEYPRALCRLMATAVVQHWRALLAQQHREELPGAWEASYCPLDPYMETEMGADCATKRVRLAE